MTDLDQRLRLLRLNRRALVPYFVGGLTMTWAQQVHAAIVAGADVVEIGVPFSDPMMDGPVIQEAAMRALGAGATLESICHEIGRSNFEAPIVVMTYFNVLHHFGLERAATLLSDNGVAGVIVPDLALEESAPWRHVASAVDVATILMVAPSTPPERVARLSRASQGFVYAAARMAVTGRASDVGDAARVVAAVRSATDTATYVGIGISTPEQAVDASSLSDGVIVGSALVQQILGGATAADTERFVAEFRRAIDSDPKTQP